MPNPPRVTVAHRNGVLLIRRSIVALQSGQESFSYQVRSPRLGKTGDWNPDFEAAYAHWEQEADAYADD